LPQSTIPVACAVRQAGWLRAVTGTLAAILRAPSPP
jgi:hypothetical protein